MSKTHKWMLNMPKINKRTRKTESGTSENYYVTIPIEIIRRMKWDKGDNLFFAPIDEKSVKIEKIDM